MRQKMTLNPTRHIFWLLCIFTLLSSFASTCAFIRTTVVFGIISRLNVLSHMPTWWIGSYIAMLPGLANWVDLELILSIHWQHGKSKTTQLQHHTNDIISRISKTHHQKRRNKARQDNRIPNQSSKAIGYVMTFMCSLNRQNDSIPGKIHIYEPTFICHGSIGLHFCQN